MHSPILCGEGLRGLVGRGSWPGIPEACLVTALRSLPARQREALVLEHYAGWRTLIGPTWPPSQPITAIHIASTVIDKYCRRQQLTARS